MSLDESIEEIEKMIGNYKITEDNYKKMILILFRIFANIPVILMGETGCGKTELIKQLMKMLNKDKENKSNNFIIKNMHSGVKEDEIIKVIEKAEENLEKSKNDMVCIFFDEINTTSLLSKMKEIFVSHSLNGKPIDERINIERIPRRRVGYIDLYVVRLKENDKKIISFRPQDDNIKALDDLMYN